MSKARQNLRKRARQLALRNPYEWMRRTFGPEWDRLHERMGHAPSVPVDPAMLPPKLVANSVYGKFAVPRVPDPLVTPAPYFAGEFRIIDFRSKYPS